MADLNPISLRELSLIDTQNTGLIGTVVAKRYHIDKELGKGKYGIALQVSDRADNNAKKVLKRVQIATNNNRDIKKVREEAGILSALNHKYIVQFMESFFDGDWFCIIMELCEGGTLDTKIEYAKSEQLPIDAQDILRWTYQVLDGLQYAHSRVRRVLHRDIKPSNILLVGNDAKLSDFGCSKQMDASTYQASSIVGTILYLAPEVHNDQVYSDKSDVWSVGCILYELFTLQPICGPSAVTMNIVAYLRHLDTKPTPALPDDRFQDLFLRMMEKDPRNRGSAAEVLEDRHFEVFQTGSNAGSEGLTIELVDDDSSNQMEGTCVIWTQSNVAWPTGDLASLSPYGSFRQAVNQYSTQSLNPSCLGFLRPSRLIPCQLKQYNAEEEKMLQTAICKSVKLALEQGDKEMYNSIAFTLPLDKLNYPAEKVARWLQDEFRRFRPFYLKTVNLVLDPNHKDAQKCRDVFSITPCEIGNVVVSVFCGDITTLKCGAIINSTDGNFHLSTGHLSQTICNKGGPLLKTEAAANPTPHRRMTSGGNMADIQSIHHIHSSSLGDVRNLVLEALNAANKNKNKSIAIPAIGTGNLQYDPAKVAQAIRGALEDFVKNNELPALKEVYIVIFQPKMLAAFQQNICY
ncbi:uncharacterized protein LOC100175525 [Ciona intestinalis]